MALALVGGAALGAAFGELLKAVVDVKDKAITFKSNLDRLESRLNSLEPIVREIGKLDRELDISPEETKMFTDRLKEAAKLVRKCSQTKCLKFFKRPSYSKKLLEFEDLLVKFFQTDVQAMQTRDSRKTLAKVNEIDGKLDRIWSGVRKGRQVCDSNVLVGSCGALRVSDFIIGLDAPLQELKMKLLQDGVQVVVLSAAGGCGKTTLAKMLCYDVEIKGKFQDNIFFVTVSKSPNLKVIVQNMFQHKNFQVPEFLNDDDAINKLGNFLVNQTGTSPKLLVLDDVWSGSESLILKFMIPIPEYKILVTSRFVFPRFHSTCKLELLNDEYAMAVFRNSAFRQGESSNIPEDLVNKIVRGCRGFPLALTVVGGSLCGQPEVIWRRTLNQWSEEGKSIFDSSSDLLIHLQTSVDALGEKIKVMECFLDLGSFPEDQRISATALIDIGVELHDLDEISALANIHDLFTRNLVNLVLTRKDASEVDGGEHFVMQHDLLRELAIHQSSQEPVEQRKRLIMEIRGNDLPKWSIEQMQKPLQAQLLSITTDEAFSSNWCNIQLPEVKVLILNFWTKNYGLPEFMEKMDQLKVLIITNYGFSPAKLSNFPLLDSLSSLKRIRLENVSVSSLGKSALQFRNLQKISLIMCEIGEAFTNCTIDIPHMFPNLVEIDIDCCIDLVKLPKGLCGIASLKKLRITKCHDLEELPEELGRLTSLDILRLHACTNLLELPKSIGSLHELRVLDISDCLSMSQLPMGIGGLRGLEKLDMRGCEFHKLPPSVKDLLKLEEVICNKEASDLWEPFKTHVTNLKINVLDEEINLNWLPNLHF
ncbi:probable disease resistance protein At5g66900 [Cornus florida]|uniref:probable disease resistance protein At5g66900 n=1 Tax=Cornus florida TaxID=4283 RepID=UPI00289E2A62|nr:probable disease resistance protein At5g66900 [Cornus florida]XP_059623800.1 probable disease resistance protein At5g66900 [Cornus florida]